MTEEERAREALSLLESPVFAAAVRHVDRAAVEKWRAAPDIASREAAHASQNALRAVVAALRAYVEPLARREMASGSKGFFALALDRARKVMGDE